jgi:hypothetical protein
MKLVRIAPLLLVAAFGSPRAAQAPANAPNFAEHIAPIVFANCTPCHRPGEATPFALQTYDDVRRRARLIAEVTSTGYMPPWHAESAVAGFRDDRRIPEDAIRALSDWVAAGTPRGDAARMPPVPQFTEGWQLGKPDLVVRMGEAMRVPEDGPDLYRNFAIPLDLAEDRWVRAIEFRPSGKASHHALFFFDTTGDSLRSDERDPAPGFAGMGFLGGVGGAGRADNSVTLRALVDRGGSSIAPVGMLGGWAVGGRPAELPAGTARRLPASASLVVQMHFHPTGRPETEQAVIGIYFADGPPQRTLVALQLPPLFGALAGIDLPAGAKRTVIRDSFTLPVDVDVLSAGGHAHYLASDMHMNVTAPGGATRQLLGIAQWDFNWQERYYFAEPLRLAAGTRIDVEIAYDNSAQNPANPFMPPQRVRFGLESTDEMGSITLELLPVREQDLARFNAAVREHLRSAAMARFAAAGGGGAAAPAR